MKSREHMGKKQSPGGSRSSAPSGAGIGMASGYAAPVAGRPSHTPKPAKMSEEMRMRAESDMGTLHRAHQIITDKSRHAAAKAHAADVFAAANAPGISISRKGK